MAAPGGPDGKGCFVRVKQIRVEKKRRVEMRREERRGFFKGAEGRWKKRREPMGRAR